MENKIIFALDVYDHEIAIDLAKNLGDKVFAIKINWPIILVNGIGIVRELSKYSRVICDFKLADIDNTNRMITEKARDYGAWGIISHAFTGFKSLKAVVDAASDMKVFSVVSLSQESYIDDVTDKLIDISKKAGVYGLVAPGNRPENLKMVKELSGDLKIISPGIGIQGGSMLNALMLGADYVIIGRSIYQSANPEETLKTIYKSISK